MKYFYFVKWSLQKRHFFTGRTMRDKSANLRSDNGVVTVKLVRYELLCEVTPFCWTGLVNIVNCMHVH